MGCGAGIFQECNGQACGTRTLQPQVSLLPLRETVSPNCVSDHTLDTQFDCERAPRGAGAATSRALLSPLPDWTALRIHMSYETERDVTNQPKSAKNTCHIDQQLKRCTKGASSVSEVTLHPQQFRSPSLYHRDPPTLIAVRLLNLSRGPPRQVPTSPNL